MGPHEKGIVMQSVKDVVKGLQDDGLVHSDKIGSSVYFWSLPRYLINMFLVNLTVIVIGKLMVTQLV